ncbi:DUF1579 domain-containing protein [soil metagenome]
MSMNEHVYALTGEWKGTNRLNLSWMPDPIRESLSTANVRPRISGQCLEIAYAWEYEGQPQEGLLILSGDPKSDNVTASWTDSWHSKNVLMSCNGTVSEDGHVKLMGHYSVPDHPDWGWRTEIVPEGDTFKYLMFNVSPEGEEDWAVATVFSRA